jgi:PPOX class probable FMN-dependent enzyme
MTQVTTIEALEALYDAPPEQAIKKVARHITPKYREWINASRFVVVATVGAKGTDASPRGDNEPVVRIGDDQTLYLPDWKGNNRLDSLRNIIHDGRISLMFMVPGCKNVVRINGTAVIETNAELIASFAKKTLLPQTVIVITVQEVYYQCAKAIMRSGIWSGEDESAKVPSVGVLLEEAIAGFDGAAYEAGYAEHARKRMW